MSRLSAAQRKKLKANHNKAEQIYKLILNSIFGKTALKAFDCELVIKNTQKFLYLYQVIYG